MNQSFTTGFVQGEKLAGNKMGTIALYVAGGGEYSFSLLNNDMNIINNNAVKRTTYSSLKMNFCIFYRQYITIPTATRYTRPCIDIGASYLLPWFFRKNTVTDGLKLSEKWLHKYNEFRFFARVGISNGAAINVSYNPFNSIKNGLQQLPKIQFGLTFQIDAQY